MALANFSYIVSSDVSVTSLMSFLQTGPRIGKKWVRLSQCELDQKH